MRNDFERKLDDEKHLLSLENMSTERSINAHALANMLRVRSFKMFKSLETVGLSCANGSISSETICYFNHSND